MRTSAAAITSLAVCATALPSSGRAPEMVTIAKRLQQKYPNEDKGFSASVWPLKVEDVSPETRRTVDRAAGSGRVVLLIACVNVANLLLTRATGRTSEVAIRTALGAGDGLSRQLLTESLLLSGAGGAIGVVLAQAPMRGINALAPQDNYHFHEIGLDWTVLRIRGGNCGAERNFLRTSAGVRGGHGEFCETPSRRMGGPGSDCGRSGCGARWWSRKWPRR